MRSSRPLPAPAARPHAARRMAGQGCGNQWRGPWGLKNLPSEGPLGGQKTVKENRFVAYPHVSTDKYRSATPADARLRCCPTSLPRGRQERRRSQKWQRRSWPVACRRLGTGDDGHQHKCVGFFVSSCHRLLSRRNRCRPRRVGASESCYVALGRHTRCGLRQSRPSSSIEVCATDNAILPVFVTGHWKRLRSKRFWNKHRP